MRKILVTTITPQDEKPKTGFRFMCKRTHRQLKDIARWKIDTCFNGLCLAYKNRSYQKAMLF